MPIGPGDVLDLIRRGRATTRGEVLHLTGLSRMTVAHRIDALLANGLVVERTSSITTGGRKPRRLRFNGSHSRVVAATLDTTHTRIALTDLNGRILADAHVDVAVASGPSLSLDTIAAAAQALMQAHGIGLDGLSGIGVSVPGPVDPDSGRPSQPPIMPGWDAYPIAERLGSAFPGVPVLTANDADAAALGEQATGFSTVRCLCLVKVSTGIGSGIVIDGRTFRGVDGGAGDIGHVHLGGHGSVQCQCGSYGCLAAVASGRAVARELTALGTPAASGRDVGTLLASGNIDAARLTQQAGRRIGEVLATVVCVLNPGVVLIGGALASASLIAGIRETLYRTSLPRATRHLTLQLGSLGADAPIVGLARLVADEQFSPAVINARLAT